MPRGLGAKVRRWSQTDRTVARTIPSSLARTDVQVPLRAEERQPQARQRRARAVNPRTTDPRGSPRAGAQQGARRGLF